MNRRALALVVTVAAVAAWPAGAQETPEDTPLVRMRDGRGSDLLFRTDPRTLRQVGRPIRTFRWGSDLELSPDGRRLAYSQSGPRRGARIHFVDVAGWRSMGVARVGRYGWLTVGWVSEDRVVAAAGEGPGPQRLLWVDARSREVVARRAYGGWTVNTLPVPGGLALVLGPKRGVGPVRVLVLDPTGGGRVIRVEGIDAGADYSGRPGRVLTPAVTVDRERGRLYIVAADELRAAEVDLATGAVAHHSLGDAAADAGASASDVGATASKGNIEVWWRQAVWAGDGRIAVTGDHWRPARRGRTPAGPDPFGVRMIDTGSWTMKTLDPRPDTMHVTGERVLASGTRYFGGRRPSRSTGLLAFDETGRRAYTRFRGELIALLGSRGGLGYVWVRRTRRVHVLDLDTGRTLEQTGSRHPPHLLSPP